VEQNEDGADLGENDDTTINTPMIAAMSSQLQ